jgi:hypothetical protein
MLLALTAPTCIEPSSGSCSSLGVLVSGPILTLRLFVLLLLWLAVSTALVLPCSSPAHRWCGRCTAATTVSACWLMMVSWGKETAARETKHLLLAVSIDSPLLVVSPARM